jgi:CRP/FNR family transcriptional regulator, anaerobic regulatory protein
MSCAFFPTLFRGKATNLSEFRELQQLATPVYYRSGTTIFAEQTQTTVTFGLSRGVVRLYKLLADGRRQVLAFALPGDFLGIPLAESHNFSADAIGDVALCRFSLDDLERLVGSSSHVMQLMIDFAIRELGMAHDHLLLLGTGSAEERVSMFLIGWRDRLARLNSVPDEVPLPMRRQDIADFLGLELETVSRTLTKLERKNAIRVGSKGVFLTGLEGAPPVARRTHRQRR